VVRLIKEKRLHAIKVGRTWRISAVSLAALLDGDSSGS
jgi:excisionase family DNA binding protein